MTPYMFFLLESSFSDLSLWKIMRNDYIFAGKSCLAFLYCYFLLLHSWLKKKCRKHLWAFHFKTEVWAYARVSPFNPLIIEKRFFKINESTSALNHKMGFMRRQIILERQKAGDMKLKKKAFPNISKRGLLQVRSRSKAAWSPEVVSTQGISKKLLCE